MMPRARITAVHLLLAGEMILCGALLAVVFTLRTLHPAETGAATQDLVIWRAAIATALLLTASLAAALAGETARSARHPAATCILPDDRATVLTRRAAILLLLAAALGLAFVIGMTIEYAVQYRQQIFVVFAPGGPAAAATQLLAFLQIAATGFVALNVIADVLLLGYLGCYAWQGPLHLASISETIASASLHWQFVMILWILLFCAFYLVR